MSYDLVDARAGTNLATGREWRTGKQVAGLRTVDVALEGFLVVQPADKKKFLTEVSQRSQHLAELHLLSFTLGPPFVAPKAIPREQYSQTNRSLAAVLHGGGRSIAPYRNRLQPRQRHRDTEATEEGAARKEMSPHELPPEYHGWFTAHLQVESLSPGFCGTEDSGQSYR